MEELRKLRQKRSDSNFRRQVMKLLKYKSRLSYPTRLEGPGLKKAQIKETQYPILPGLIFGQSPRTFWQAQQGSKEGEIRLE